MAVLLGLVSVACLSLFLSRVLSRSLSLMPLVALGICSVWFTLLGCLNLLRMGGWLWYAACLACGLWVVYKEKGALLKRITPGFVFFVLGGVFFTVLYSATQPLLSNFDEFTFWGTAAKAVSETNQMYTVATSNLIARSYPPALTVISYAMQFFGGFTEHGLMASYCLIYLAGFAAASAYLDKRPASAALLLGALFLLPLLFETAPLAGGASWAYITVYADPALAAVFGGALALYFAGGKPDGRLLLMLGFVLAFLTNIKDMGFALAMLVWLVVLLDLVFCARDEVRLWGQKRWKALLCFAGVLLLAVAATYLLWLFYMRVTTGQNRLDFGNDEKSLNPLDMVLGGALALFGINPPEHFSFLLGEMLRALWQRPVSLLGSGRNVFAIIVVLLAFTWLLCRTKQQRRRVVVFAASAAVGFVAYYIFQLFLYVYVFSWVEAQVLKDYDRYLFPYWMGWLMAALTLLSATAVSKEGRAAWRTAVARLTIGGVGLCMVAGVALRTNLNANFLRISPSHYTLRWQAKDIVAAAEAEGMQRGHRVYILNQLDDGTQFYIMGFEMQAIRVPMYAGTAVNEEGETVLRPGLAAGWLWAGEGDPGPYSFEVTPAQFSAFLAQNNCTHLLVYAADHNIVRDYSEMFSDGFAGYLGDGRWDGGARYWRIEYGEDGLATFVPEGGGGQ